MAALRRLPFMTHSRVRLGLMAVAGCLALAPFAVMAQTTGADFERYGSINFSASNQTRAFPNGSLRFFNEDGSGTFTDGLLHTYSTDITYYGLDQNSNENYMNFQGTGTVRGDYGVIKTRYEGTLFNSFFNEDNIPLYDSVNDIYDSSGTPDVMQGVATAGWVDTLQYGGTATGYLASYVFRITGRNENFKSFSLLDVTIGSGAAERFLFMNPGNVDEIVRTAPVFIGQAGQKASVQMNTIFQPNLRELALGEDVYGDSNFSNTVEFLGVELRDMDGNLVTDVSIIGMSGTEYQAVPEPATMVVLGGLLTLGILRKRKAKA